MLLAYSFTQSVGTRVPLSCRRYERTNERSPFFVGGISREANLNPATRTARTDARTDQNAAVFPFWLWFVLFSTDYIFG